MTTRNTINTLFLDIETGKADDYELFMPEFKEPRKNKDGTDNKADKSIAEQRTEWESKLALSPLTGKVLMYGYISDEEEGVGFVDEEISEKMILELLTVYLEKADLIIGHNIKDFDLWFIYNRCRKHGIPFPEKLYSYYHGKFGWKEHIHDTMNLFTCGKYKEFISLNNLCKFFGLETKDESIGKNFEKIFNEDREKAIEYCRQDVLKTKQVYERLTHTVERIIN